MKQSGHDPIGIYVVALSDRLNEGVPPPVCRERGTHAVPEVGGVLEDRRSGEPLGQGGELECHAVSGDFDDAGAGEAFELERVQPIAASS